MKTTAMKIRLVKVPRKIWMDVLLSGKTSYPLSNYKVFSVQMSLMVCWKTLKTLDQWVIHELWCQRNLILD
jgi:hypothetical protein